MEASEVTSRLAGGRLLALESCVFIYALEGGGELAERAAAVLRCVQEGRNPAVMSCLGLLEVQVGPYRAGREDLSAEYYASLLCFPNLRLVPLGPEVADRAARLRAEHRVSTPDSIHLATAIESSASVFVTNDLDLPALNEIDYLLLGGREGAS